MPSGICHQDWLGIILLQNTQGIEPREIHPGGSITTRPADSGIVYPLWPKRNRIHYPGCPLAQPGPTEGLPAPDR